MYFTIDKMLFFSDEIPCNNNNPCQNGGTCYGTVLNYQCTCRVGYTGTNCESKKWNNIVNQINVLYIICACNFNSSMVIRFCIKA